MFDSDLMFRDGSGAHLTVSEVAIPAAAPLHLGPNLVPCTIQLHVPTIFAAADTLDVTILGSDDAAFATSVVAGTFPQITGAGAAGEYYLTIKRPYRYYKATLTTAGAAPDFGAVQLGPVPGGEYDHW